MCLCSPVNTRMSNGEGRSAYFGFLVSLWRSSVVCRVMYTFFLILDKHDMSSRARLREVCVSIQLVFELLNFLHHSEKTRLR